MNYSGTPFKAATLLLLAALLFLCALNAYQLRGSTEPRVAGIAAEVLIDNDWVTPKLNGTPFLEKPPLSIWLDAVGITIFGATPFAVRLASALAGLSTALILFWQLSQWESQPEQCEPGKRSQQLRQQQPTQVSGWLAGLLLITMAQFWSNVRQVGEDALLTLGVTLCLLMFLRAQTRQSLGAWLLFAVGLAIATLSKGVLGLALPGAVIFAYLLCRTLIDRHFSVWQWLRPAAATALGLIPLAIWLALLYRHNGSHAVTEVLWANSVGRFGGEFENNGHFEPFYYYLTKLPEVFLPWNILVFLGVWQLLKRVRHERFALFLCCWLLAPFILLSLSSGKRMVYLLALYPAAAVIGAAYCRHLLDTFKSTAPTTLTYRLYRHHQTIMAGLIALISGGLLYHAAIWEPKQDRKESLLPVIQQLAELLHSGRQVALFQPSERLAGATVFYAGQRLPELDNIAALRTFLTEADNNVAVLQATATPAADFHVLYQTQVGKRGYIFLTR